MRPINVFLQYPRVLIHDYLYLRSSRQTIEGRNLKEIIDQDVDRYLPKKNISKKERVYNLNYLLLSNKVFRTQFYYRINSSPLVKSFGRILAIIFLRPLDNLEIGVVDTRFIDGGLRIMHSSGCVISTHTAGKNLTVFQGVTIGQNGSKKTADRKNPIIGSNVTIYANAVVCGPITIGDNVTIGTGTIVTKDVPSNCTVIGNPARIIEKDGIKVNQLL